MNDEDGRLGVLRRVVDVLASPAEPIDAVHAWAHVVTARAAIEARVLVTERLTPLRIEGRTVHQLWLPYHFGSEGLVTGDAANDLIGITLDPNVLIQESKVGTCDIQPGRRPAGKALLAYVAEYRRRAGLGEGGHG